MIWTKKESGNLEYLLDRDENKKYQTKMTKEKKRICGRDTQQTAQNKWIESKQVAKWYTITYTHIIVSF